MTEVLTAFQRDFLGGVADAASARHLHGLKIFLRRCSDITVNGEACFPMHLLERLAALRLRLVPVPGSGAADERSIETRFEAAAAGGGGAATACLLVR